MLFQLRTPRVTHPPSTSELRRRLTRHRPRMIRFEKEERIKKTKQHKDRYNCCLSWLITLNSWNNDDALCRNVSDQLTYYTQCNYFSEYFPEYLLKTRPDTRYSLWEAALEVVVRLSFHKKKKTFSVCSFSFLHSAVQVCVGRPEPGDGKQQEMCCLQFPYAERAESRQGSKT